MLKRFREGLIRFFQRFGWGRAFGLALLVALFGLRVWDPTALQLLRLKTFDLYQIAKPREPSARPVLIVDIDEASLNAVGQWPWPRTTVAKLIEKIAAGGLIGHSPPQGFVSFWGVLIQTACQRAGRSKTQQSADFCHGGRFGRGASAEKLGTSNRQPAYYDCKFTSMASWRMPGSIGPVNRPGSRTGILVPDQVRDEAQQPA